MYRFMKSFLFLLLPVALLLGACGDREEALPGAAADSLQGEPAPVFGISDTSLHEALRKIEAGTAGHLGVAAIHLESGWRTSYRGNETFPMASVGKLPMAIHFLSLVDSGAYSLDSVVTLTSDDHSPGGSRIFGRAARQGASLHDLLEASIGTSDNTACDYLLRLSGGPAPVDAMLGTFGLHGIDVSNYERELIMLWAGIDPASSDSVWTRTRIYARIQEVGDTVWRAAEARMVDDPSDAAQPEHMAMLLAMLHRRELLAPTTTDTLLAVMSRAVVGRGRIPAMLPPGTPVAHKTGTISSTTNDVGIITLPEGRGHLAVALFVKGSRVGVRVRERAIASAALLIYRHVMEGGR